MLIRSQDREIIIRAEVVWVERDAVNANDWLVYGCIGGNQYTLGRYPTRAIALGRVTEIYQNVKLGKDTDLSQSVDSWA